MPPVLLTDTPDFITNASLRDYQLHGVSTLLGWYQRGVGGILADEMGLGKTIQTIAFLGCLKADLGLSGPHLVIVPLPVLQNWANELIRFAPSLSFRKISGSKAERTFCLGDDRTQRAGFDVYLTTYETVQCEEAFFADCWSWATVTIDEGHRIKNEKSSLRRALNRIDSPFRLLLTGTPLQNNLHELWALLNYILPNVFKASRTFDEAARVREDVVDVDVCAAARSLLDRAMMLRRLKRDVETSLLPKVICKLFVDMTPLQLRLYKGILQRSDALHVSSMLSMPQLLATLSQLHKVVNHPKQILNFREKARLEEAKRIANNTYAGAVPTTHSLTHISYLSLIYPITHSLTHAITHSLTHAITHSLTHAIAQSLYHSLTHAITHSLTHSCYHSLTISLTHYITHSLRCGLLQSQAAPPASLSLQRRVAHGGGAAAADRRPAGCI
jgi:SNF2 family DNA or RNA helicase